MEKEQLIKLVTAAQSGDSNAQGELFSCFYNDIYYFALKTVKDEELACDVTQETFIEIINTITALKEPAAFVTWAKQITYHQCTRYFKKKKDVIVGEDEEGHTIFDDLKEENTEFIPDEALDKSDFKKTILAILDELSEEQRSATMMYYFDEMSVSEIARIQGVSEGTIKSRLNYARKSIKQSVEDYEKKNGIKLHAIPFFPLFKFVFEGAFEKGLPTASLDIIAKGVSSATGASIASASTGTAVGTAATTAATTTTAGAVTTATTATATTIGAKIAALPIATKIIAGIVAATITIGGTSTAIILSNENNGSNNDSSIVSSGENGFTAERFKKDLSGEEALDVYGFCLDNSYDLPYFSSSDELSMDDMVRFTYNLWGTHEENIVREISIQHQDELLQAVFGRSLEADKLTDKVASLSGDGQSINMTFDNPTALRQNKISGYSTPVKLSENEIQATIYHGSSISKQDGIDGIANGRYSENEIVYIGYLDHYIKPDFYKTITIKNINGYWQITACSNQELPRENVDQQTSADNNDYNVYVVPQDAVYITSSGKVFKAGETVTVSVSAGDILKTDDYIYKYDYSYEYYPEQYDAVGTGDQDLGWKEDLTGWSARVKDMTKTRYEPLLENINNARLVNLNCTFAGCVNMVVAPEIPSTVEMLCWTFANCRALKEAPDLSNCISRIYLVGAFRGCHKLTVAPVLPSNVESLCQTFVDCTSLVEVPNIPNGVTDMYGAFTHCTSLKTVPVIPASVDDLTFAFVDCTSLTGTITINAKLGYESVDGAYANGCDTCFRGTVQPIVIKGSCNKLQELAASANNGNVTVG